VEFVAGYSETWHDVDQLILNLCFDGGSQLKLYMNFILPQRAAEPNNQTDRKIHKKIKHRYIYKKKTMTED